MPDYQEGQTASSKDGRKIIFTNGQWVNKAPDPIAAQQGSPAERRQAEAALIKEQQPVDVARRALNAMTEFDAINNRLHPRGGFIGSVGNTVSRWMGNADLNRLDQLSKGFARTQRQPGEGTTSDYEGRLYEMMVGGADRPYQTNVDFSKAAHQQANDIIDRHQFRDAYVAQHGSLVGADAAFANSKRSAPPSTRKPAQGGWTVQEIKDQ